MWETLSFQERQKSWTGFLRQFIQNNGRGKKPHIWTIQVDGDRVTTTHGVVDGQMQTTNYCGKAKNIGRSNAIDSATDALAEARRDVRKRYDFEGYDELWNGKNVDKRNTGVSVQHLLTSLPGSFCLYKPENNFWDQKKLLEKAREGKVWYTLKRDGMAHWIVNDYYNNIQIYSRRSRSYHKDEGPTELPDGTLDYSTVIPWAARWPHLVEAVKRMHLPPGSMMAGELVYPGQTKDEHGWDWFAHIQSITKSLTPQAILDMREKGLPFFYWWDLPFYDGVDLVSNWNVKSRFGLLAEVWQTGELDVELTKDWIIPIQIKHFDTPELALARAKELDIEGWVVVDPEGIYKDKGWNLKGKPDRPSCCAKLKPKDEDDFIAKFFPEKGSGEWGTGKHEYGKLVTLPSGEKVYHGGVGSIGLFQYNSKNELVFISNCSSGMDYEFQAKLRPENFPFVCKVEYPERTYMAEGEKTNALRHPVFLMKRDDKSQSECINDRL